jgi:phage terminase Nu1 subunit (DNA packaging protein)
MHASTKNENEPFKTQVAIAKHYGCSVKAVQLWTHKEGWPEVPTPASVDAFLNEMRSEFAPDAMHSSDVPKEELNEALKRAELAKLLEEIRAKRLKNDLVEGQLVARDECHRAWAEMVLEAKARIEAIPEALEMLFPQSHRAQLTLEVRNAIHLILKQMSGVELPQ